MPFNKLPLDFDLSNKSHVADLHNALAALKLVSKTDNPARELDQPLKKALTTFKKDNGLGSSASLTPATVSSINLALHDQFIVSNKKRVSGLHTMLEKLNIPIDKAEKTKRITGNSTRDAIISFQRENNLPPDGKISEELYLKLDEAFLDKKLSAKTQVFNIQKDLLTVRRIAKMEERISEDELKNKEIGPSTTAFIKDFQIKYKIEPSGKLDRITLDKIQSIVTSRGVAERILKKENVDILKPVKKQLRLNSSHKSLIQVHQTLAHLGYAISEKEYNTTSFGKSTRNAVLAFQQSRGLPLSGHLEGKTLKAFNKEIIKFNPEAASGNQYRIKGSVRDELWNRKNNMVLKIYENTIEGKSAEPLMTKKNMLNGFFDITYPAPVNQNNGQVKTSFDLLIELHASKDSNPANDTLIEARIFKKVNRIQWVNFTLGDDKYQGDAEFTVLMADIKKSLDKLVFTTITETPANRQIKQLSGQTGISTDEIMRLLLAHKIAANINKPDLTPEVFYAFLSQNLPAELPGDLYLPVSIDWGVIDTLIETVESGIGFLDTDTQTRVIETAIEENLVSRQVFVNKANVLKGLAELQVQFSLSKPILVGNGSINTLIANSTIDESHSPLIAKAFIANKGFNDAFWDALTAEPSINNAQVADLKATVDLGGITKNFEPVLKSFKNDIGAGKKFATVGAIAKLNTTQLENYLTTNGGNIPAGFASVADYAAMLKQRSEAIFPGIALVASLKSSAANPLTQLAKAETFFDTNTDFNIHKDTVDNYLAKNTLVLDSATKADVKTLVRVRKLTDDAATATTLLENKLHTSSQLYFAGKERITKLMSDENTGSRVYEKAKMQYAQVIGKLLHFKPELNTGTPAAISKQTYTPEEIKLWLGDIPDLETLFGNQDFCECEHCKSLYSPSAYLVDMLRFLKQHVAVNPAKTVKDVLFERRPDLGNIKLNCVNTDTPIPYIDLVCEVLENTIRPLPLNASFNFQTTLTKAELRAMPQNVRKEAYDLLAKADFPMNSSFDLQAEETRTYLNFLGIPRYQVMQTFRDTSVPAAKIPDDVTIAAEYFGISQYETELITTVKATKPKQEVYWAFDKTKDAVWQDPGAPGSEVSVKSFMNRSQLQYNQLLDLLTVQFVNPNGAAQSKIERPVNSCNTNEQKITKLTPARMDLMHRFIRLWRKTGWQMWELDLLLRNAKIGAGALTNTALVNLMSFKQVQQRLSLSTEALLAFYGDIITEDRINPARPEIVIPSLYQSLFQNATISNPVDNYFKLPLNNTVLLSLNAVNAPLFPVAYSPVSVILSALSIGQTEFDKLVAKTNGHLNLPSLSTIMRFAFLAKSLNLTVEDLLSLMQVNNQDPFLSPQDTLEFLQSLEHIKGDAISIAELDYVLNFNPASPIGWRDEVYTQLLSSLKETLILTQQSVDELQLSAAEQNLILAFNADGLTPLADNQLSPTIAPLVTLLLAKKDSLDQAKFADEQRLVITNFDASPVTPIRKTKLIESILGLQKDLQTILNQATIQVQSFVANTYSLQENQASILLKLIFPPVNPVTLLELLTDKAILQPGAVLTNQKNALVLLHKISILILRMNIDYKYLQWFIANATTVKTLDFANLPIAAVGGANQYLQWLTLSKFYAFKNTYPEPEDASLITILNAALSGTATIADCCSEINKVTQWDKAGTLNLKNLSDKLKLTKANFLEADTFERLQRCFEMLKIAGVDALTLFGWNNIAATDSAVQTRLAIKSKYQNEDWLAKITPLQDDLREKKRSALVAYFIEYAQRNEDPVVASEPNPLYWTDSNQLFKYFLIDVEMSACQLTSRIKQAISSVQFFVQRCFLNLESRLVKVTQSDKEDVSSPNAWSQWKWMKNYRVWEANRKVFFYPENWIEPELRDDKSSFFEELESDILQAEINHENAEAAYQNYLHKLDEVANLDVCGLYHEQEDENLSVAGYERDITHVVGRTKAIPHIYYYRQYDNNFSIWTAWEKIDLDIAGDNLTPVVYNRKLHLFWLVMQQKPIKVHKIPSAQPTAGASKTQDAQEPAKYWEIQLAWSVQTNKGWSSKKVSKEKFIHPWQRPLYSYHLKPYYFQKFNQLYLDLYLSTSSEFNSNVFYDQETGTKHRMTANPYNETFLAWHSSSFIFDGNVTSLKLKDYGGSYGKVRAEFEEETRALEVLDVKEFGPRLRLPNGMHLRYNRVGNNQQALNASQFNAISSSATSNLLTAALNPFEAVITQQDKQIDFSQHNLFYQDQKRAYFIKPEFKRIFNSYNQYIGDLKQYRFMPFYHPYTTLFIRELNRRGIDGLLTRNIQVSPQSFTPQNTFDFSAYQPSTNSIVDETAKKDTVDFSLGGAYSIYNWEMFFHAPLMIACKLMQNQRFEEAMRWFHYIFDPTNIEPIATPQRYWITKPFFEYNAEDYRKQRIENILKNIDSDENQAELKAWRNNPFKPHLIARYRPVAYQKTVVMKYIDNLIGWGDMLFRRDTIEAINEASLLYMLAYELLGDKPVKVPNVSHEDKSFNEIEAKLDDFGNASIDVLLEDTLLPIQLVATSETTEPLPKLDSFYFCIPNNDFVLKYWDLVEDRLFKIRRCMNIEGVVRQLPLFEPPIDPAILVKAAASGIDIGSVLNDLSAGSPNYRFRVMHQKAVEFCSDVKVLGDKLLSILEKKDAESLSLLRSQHEIQLLKAVKDIREKQIDEAVEAIGALNKGLELATAKEDYYSNLQKQNSQETASIAKIGDSIAKIDSNITEEVTAGWLNAIPTFNVGIAGFGGSPTVGVSLGPQIATSVMSGYISSANSSSTKFSQESQRISTQGSYDRRKAEWDYQAQLARIEKKQIQFQINAAEIRQAIAEKELADQELQIENAETVNDYMKNKYTNAQLYSWMLSQISTVYFQAYQLAFDMAKKAEKCYQYELGIDSTNFIQPLYWDSLKKGLLSGDKLMYDLHRIDAAYLENNNRELEIRKHISLSQLFPLQLIRLRETGKCSLILPEWLFNMDYPGHYFRRIKNVSISIPCIAGPYTSINCTLSLFKSTIRINPTGNQYAAADENDLRFKTQMGAITSVATSHAQNDTGLFELNFNDERYLPFEGLGVQSEWEVSLPKENNYFNFESITDVILHINYTARNAGTALAQKAMTDLDVNLPKNVARLFSLKHEFPNEWYQFLNPALSTLPKLTLNLKTEHYPFFVRGKLNTLKLKNADIWIESTDGSNISADLKVTSGSVVAAVAIDKDPSFNNTPHAKVSIGNVNPTGEVSLILNTANELANITDIYLLIQS